MRVVTSTRLDVGRRVCQLFRKFKHVRHASSAALEIQGLCVKGQLDDAVDVLLRMEEEGKIPSMRMYSTLLKACVKRSALAQAQRVHAHVAKHGWDANRVMGEHIVSALVQCGGLSEALQLFHRLPCRTQFSWTAIISGYTRAGQCQEALKMYYWMQQEGLEPNKYTLVNLLRACGSLSDLEEGKRIHAEVLKYRLESDVFVGTCLINMYTKCSRLTEARKVFDELPDRNVVTWNVLLSAYAQKGHARMALQLYEEMQKKGVSPDDRTFVSTLQACGMLAEDAAGDILNRRGFKANSLERAKQIHSDARSRGYDADVFVGNTLVSMYGKFGSLVHAQDVFDGLFHRNVVSWNALLTAYVQHGQAEKVLHLYDQMRESCVSPDVRTFMSVLQGCGVLAGQGGRTISDVNYSKEKLLERAKQIHGEARRKDYDSHVYLGNTLITMYGNFGSIVDALSVFEGLSHPDVVSWNAMLTVYVEMCQAERAGKLYEQMREEGPSADGRTYMSALQAYCMLADREGNTFMDGLSVKANSLDKAKAIHADARSKSKSGDGFVASTLVNLYGKCGSVADAWKVFDELPHQDVVSWNTMLGTCLQNGQAEKALQLYEQMWAECISPDVRTFVIALQACGILGEKQQDSEVDQSSNVWVLERGKAVHADALKKGFCSDVFVGGALISLYGKCKDVLSAQHVFDGLPHWDVVLWNVILAAYAEQGQAGKMLQLYDEMHEEGVSPDSVTYVSILEACGMVAEKEVATDGEPTKDTALNLVKSIHSYARRKGHDADVSVGNTLMKVYKTCGSIEDTESLFAGLPHRSTVSWNVMVGAYVQQGDSEKALQLYKQMQEEEVIPDEGILLNLLQLCSSMGSLDVCKEIHDTLVAAGKDTNLVVASSLIHAYGRCACMGDAQAVFDALPQPDLVAWSALIAGYAQQGDCEASLQCYVKMQMAGLKPDRVTFVSLLSACSHAGYVEKGLQFFESMTSVYAIAPEIDHYACMVDLLGRAGDFSRVEQMLSGMPMQPDLPMLLSLLAACRKHGKVELGKQAFDAAVQLHPSHAAAYVLMSDLYADAGLWDHASEMSALQQKASAGKKLGQSWIKHDQQLHTFVVDDHVHPRNELLYNLLATLRPGGMENPRLEQVAVA